MSKTMFFGVVAAVVLAQVYDANAQQEQQPDNCKQNIFEQLKKTNMSQYMNCFNVSSLQDLKSNSQVLRQLFTSLPDGCKNPLSSNIKECAKSWFSNLKNHSSEVQKIITNGFNTLFDASKDCISQAAQQLSDLNIFVTNGCQDG